MSRGRFHFGGGKEERRTHGTFINQRSSKEGNQDSVGKSPEFVVRKTIGRKKKGR